MSIDGKDLCDKAIDMASGKGVTYVEARFVQNQNNQFILKNGTPELGIFDRTSGIGLRLIVDGAMGFASFNSFDNETMKTALNQAIKLAKSSARLRKTPIVLSEEKTSIKKYSVQGEKADPEEKMKMLFEIDKSISSLPIPFRIVFLMDSETRRYFVNSDGSQVESYTPRLNFYSILTAVDATRGSMEQAHYSKGASGGFEWVKKWNLYEFLRNEATILSKVASEAKDPPKGNIDIVIGSELAGLIAHENCGHPSEADRILGREAAQAGESFLSIDKLGEKIGTFTEWRDFMKDLKVSGTFFLLHFSMGKNQNLILFIDY